MLPLVSALWLGILTSISPCPLASNVVAITFVARDVARPRRVLAAGMLYTFGRAAAYVGLAALIVGSLQSIPSVSRFLQERMNQVLGPVLIVAGVFLLNLISPSRGSGGIAKAVEGHVEKLGLFAAALLGFLFALSFCPVSAALFFGSLIPLSLQHSPPLLYAVAYGVGTALPVIAIAIGLASGAKAMGEWLKRLGKVESIARTVTGIAFIGVGIHFVLRHIFEVI